PGWAGAEAEAADVAVPVDPPPLTDVGDGTRADNGIDPALGGIDHDIGKDTGCELEFGADLPEPPSRKHVQHDGFLWYDPVKGGGAARSSRRRPRLRCRRATPGSRIGWKA